MIGMTGAPALRPRAQQTWDEADRQATTASRRPPSPRLELATSLAAAAAHERPLHVAAEHVATHLAGRGRRVMSRVAARLAADLRAGITPSRALARQPRRFDAWEVELLRVGEVGARTSDALGAWRAALEARERARDRFRDALAPPAVVIAATLATGLLVPAEVVDAMVALVVEADGGGPAATTGAAIVAFRGGLAVVALATLGGAFGLARAARHSPAAARLLAGLPIVGSISRRQGRALMLDVVAAARASGIGEAAAFRLAALSQPNAAHASELRSAARRLAACGELPPPRGAGARSRFPGGRGLLDRRSLRALRAALASTEPAERLARLATRERRGSEAHAERCARATGPLAVVAAGVVIGLLLVGAVFTPMARVVAKLFA